MIKVPVKKLDFLSNASFSGLWAGVSLISIVLMALYVRSGFFLLLFLGVVITTHEAGHYFFAKRAGMKPTEFFWGFGPEVFVIEKNDCRYGIKVLSLGGYVKLEGMTHTSELPEGFDESGTYRSASFVGKLTTILAGPFVNIISAFLAFSIAEITMGNSILFSIKKGIENSWFIIDLTFSSLGLWFVNIGSYVSSIFGNVSEAPVRFMSPISQAQYSEIAVSSGFSVALQWFGILSCAIGILNLVPLPPLDGSHAFTAVIEWVFNKLGRNTFKFNTKKLLPAAYLTIALLVLLSGTALIMDIRDLAGG